MARDAPGQVHWYRHYGLNLRSALPMPMLCLGDPAAAVDLDIVYGSIDPDDMTGRRQYQNWYAERGELTFHGFGVGRLHIVGGTRIIVDRDPAVADSALVSILLGTGMAAVLMQRRMLPIHGCSIATDRGAILFVGRSGAGKSTLLGGLMAAGCTMLADDVTGLRIDEAGRAMAVPAFPAMRLWGDSIGLLGWQDRVMLRVRDDIAKFYVGTDRFHPDPMPVRAIVLLGGNNSTAVDVRPVMMGNRVEALSRYVHRKKFLQPLGLQQWAFDTLVRTAAGIDMVAVSRPSIGATPAAMADVVIDHFGIEVAAQTAAA